MPYFSLFLIAPEAYGVHEFATDGSIWSETDDTKTTASRNTDEATPRASVMQFTGKSFTLGDGITLGDGYFFGDSDDGKGEGVYYDFTVVPGGLISFTCLFKVQYGATLTIIVYDQSNTATIETVDKTDSSWTSYTYIGTVPDGCTTIRIKFLQKSTSRRTGPYLIDNVAFNASAIASDPDRYQRIPEVIGSLKETLDGSRIFDSTGIHHTLVLGWNYVNKSMLDDLMTLFFSDEVLYFTDGEVPPLIESENVYETITENYVGITNPSSTNIAYSDESASLPSAVDDFNSNEISTANYQAIDADDANNVSTTFSDVGYYGYHRYEIKSDVSSGDAQRLRVNIAAQITDDSAQNIDGAVLYIWDSVDEKWVEIARHSSSAKTYMIYSTANANLAQRYIDANDDYVRLLLRSRATQVADSDITVKTFFAEVEVNENLDLVINLSHKAILDDSDDLIWVKNLTTGSTLTLTTHYTISNDQREVTIIGQSSGDEIEVKYNRYFEVKFINLPEDWHPGDPGNDRYRECEVRLRTLEKGA